MHRAAFSTPGHLLPGGGAWRCLLVCPALHACASSGESHSAHDCSGPSSNKPAEKSMARRAQKLTQPSSSRELGRGGAADRPGVQVDVDTLSRDELLR